MGRGEAAPKILADNDFRAAEQAERRTRKSEMHHTAEVDVMSAPEWVADWKALSCRSKQSTQEASL
jgi:hypothetical protein